MLNFLFFQRHNVIVFSFAILLFPLSTEAKPKQKIEKLLETVTYYQMQNDQWVEKGTSQKYYHYDPQGRLIEQKSGSNIENPKTWDQTTYDTFGDLTRTSLSSEGKVLSVESTINYTKPSERTIVNSSGTITLKFFYTYDDQGKLVELTKNDTHGITSKTVYDHPKNQYRETQYDDQKNEKGYTIGEIKGRSLETYYTSYAGDNEVVAKRVAQRSQQESLERIVIDEYSKPKSNEVLALALHVERIYSPKGVLLEEITKKYDSKGEIISTKSTKNIIDKDGSKKQIAKVSTKGSEDTITVINYDGNNKIKEQLVYLGQMIAESLTNKETYEYKNDSLGNLIQSIKLTYHKKDKSLIPEQKVITTREISYYPPDDIVTEVKTKKSKVLIIE